MTCKVLVVEDEILIALEVEDTLAGAGYDVLGPASSVNEALSLLRNQTPDAAVLDVNLGGERVTPVAEVLRASEIPYILASGYGPSELEAYRALRDVTNVGKPFNAERLLSALKALLSASRTKPE